MVTFRNNNYNIRKPSFRNNNNRRSSFRRNDEGSKFKSNFSNNDNFQRKISGRNNYNASKLIEKYNNLGREALANEDKILSENYFQHADHFTRIQNEQENNKITKANTSPEEVTTSANLEEKKDITLKEESKVSKEHEKKKIIKPIEKHSITS